MAKEDYNVADRVIDSLEAGDKVQETVASTPDADAAAFAATEEVSTAAYANYGTALTAYGARDDIESLADRRAREIAVDFADTEHMRAPVSDTPPTPGSTNGIAPTSE